MAEDHEVVKPNNVPKEQPVPQNTIYRSTQHSQTLLDGLVGLRDGGILFDVVLKLEGRCIEAHRILLAASCDYFRGMFAGGLREMDQREVQIYGITYNAMCKILDFIYTSELELGIHNVQEILAAACQLQISEVISFCCDFLISWVDEENVVEVYKLAELFHLRQLSEQLDAFVLKNFNTFSRTQIYRQLPLEKVYSLLSSNKLAVGSENEVYEGALLYHYTAEQVETDQVSLSESPKLLETVRFALMEFPVLQRLHDKLGPCPLKVTVSNALKYHKDELMQPVLQGPHTQLRSEFKCVVGFGGMYTSVVTVLSDQAKYLNPLIGEWRPLTAPQAPRMSNQGIAVFNNFVYLIGGDNNVRGYRAEAQCWRYDPRHNRWFQIQSMQQPRADLSVCVLGKFIYAVAGRDYHDELKEVERYDPYTNTWEYVASLQKQVHAHAGCDLDGKMYISCGRRENTYLKETYCYDPDRDQWARVAQGPVSRAWHGMVAVLDKLYVIGGSNDDEGFRQDLLEVACYCPKTDQWSLVTPLPVGHGEPGITVLENKIYVLGGRSHNQGRRTDYAHIYDAEKDLWDEGPQLEEEVSGMAACVVTLPRSILIDADVWTQEMYMHYMERAQNPADHISEGISVSDWEDLDNSGED
ncbi:kelch-like protein 22 isoform X1 [Hyla sarda]|uniref:kelch-like protein 22 isoform X1 n=1 Tax=Hyla sarda TaxID=327740 RepID=UPI0024C270EA|nr:kelch-like protein 22 isoform X1 [Hyla sarda]XP_056387068.1 kelch-like protein 22 isoform X1 [Hyla sarda]XP_056387074.1 kelch-like protein 22 isoform X1 [Hyla sarda]XP_056387085.1 kelch-like protein 22 isoform X1 [Hyla sarda]XP_056387093.1 kelch-like protein 22 isoform X1 [Hyla sarda]